MVLQRIKSGGLQCARGLLALQGGKLKIGGGIPANDKLNKLVARVALAVK